MSLVRWLHDVAGVFGGDDDCVEALVVWGRCDERDQRGSVVVDGSGLE